MVLVFVILYFVFPQHRLLGQNIYLVSHSAYSIFRDFVDGRHLRIGVKSMRIFMTVLFVASLSLFWVAPQCLRVRNLRLLKFLYVR